MSKKRPFGSFIQDCVDGVFDEPIPTPKFHADQDKKVLERVLFPRKIKALEAKVAKLRSVSGRSDQRRKKAAPMKEFVRAAKSKFDHIPHSQLDVAKRVDGMLEKAKTTLSAAVPQSWKKLGLPRTLTEVFTNPSVDPTLKKFVKTYISKA